MTTSRPPERRAFAFSVTSTSVLEGVHIALSDENSLSQCNKLG